MRRLALPLLAALLLPAPLLAGKLYKWVDEEGNTHYSDKVPPQHVTQQHSTLNQRGMTIETTGAAKTPEEIAREQELEKLRAEQARILEEQQAKDRALLRTFRTEDDLAMARDGKLAAFDQQIRVSHDNIKRLKQNLANKQANAANLERQGKKVDKKFLDEIDSYRQQIESSYAGIVRKEHDREYLRQRFDADLKRFRELRPVREDNTALGDGQNPEQQFSLVETLLQCTDRQSCDQLWEHARTYAKQRTDTTVQMDADSIFISAYPIKDDQLSISVTRMRAAEEARDRIFLDVQCRNTPTGEATCNGERAQQIRSEFRALQP